ncbi:MAG: DUF2791 family P-loop domain-containing protein [Desulfamplus sp.]|nr:DUF2791 family P-loop domain-containing protein [Desulfamplus sp.]
MKNNQDFEKILKDTPNFKLRRAMERLREGLFDPIGVRLLTTGDMDINQHFETQIKNLEKGKNAHLCVCGAYGQGKSHTLNYIQQRALEENYAVSYINLDPREVPFHNLKQVYHSLMENLAFPCETVESSNPVKININPLNSSDALTNNSSTLNSSNALNNSNLSNSNSLLKNSNLLNNNGTLNISMFNGSSTFVDIWKKKVRQWLSLSENRDKSVLDMIPETTPHRFKSILAAMALQTEAIPNDKRNLKKHVGFKPREFPWILNSAFMGKEIPVIQLRNALRYRKVSFYNEESLSCKDDRIYLESIQAYAALFQNMGYKGWIVLFDEAESIMLTRINQRAKSYSLLHELFCPDRPIKGFCPVFAFTHDFFTHLKNEDFERTRIIKKQKTDSLKITNTSQKKEILEKTDMSEEKENPFFERNYSKAWHDINIYRLRNLTSNEWHLLIRKLIQIHALAYRWEPDVDAMDKIIFSRLLKQSEAESRMKLKLIVNLLDLEQQQMVISTHLQHA